MRRCCAAAHRPTSRSRWGSGPAGVDMRGLGEIAERLRRSSVQVVMGGRSGGGSGVIWRSDGLVVTNAHVTHRPEALVELWDGRSVEARVTARDPRRDLATLRITATGLEAATPGDSTALRPGAPVIAGGSRSEQQ